MFNLSYDPATKVYRIDEDGTRKEGKFNVYQVFQILQNYIIKRVEAGKDDSQ